MKSLLLLVLALLALGASALAWYEFEQVKEMRAEGMTADERQELRKAAFDAQKQVHRLEGQLSAAHVMKTADEDAKPGADNRQALGQMAADYFSKLDDPDVRRLMDLQRLAGINRQYAQFFRDAHLTPEQVQQFQQLMLERQRAESDVLIAASNEGINPMSNPGEFRQMVRQAQAEVDKQIQASLGTDDFQQFQQFQQASNQHGLVNQLRQDLSFTDAPLTDAQTTQMMSIVQQTNKPGGNTVSDKTLSLAQGVLAPAQVQALQNIQQLQQTNQQLQQLLQGKPSNPPPATPAPKP